MTTSLYRQAIDAGLSPGTVYRRVRVGWPVDVALSAMPGELRTPSAWLSKRGYANQSRRMFRDIDILRIRAAMHDGAKAVKVARLHGCCVRTIYEIAAFDSYGLPVCLQALAAQLGVSTFDAWAMWSHGMPCLQSKAGLPILPPTQPSATNAAT